jgi:hypothetical protein
LKITYLVIRKARLEGGEISSKEQGGEISSKDEVLTAKDATLTSNEQLINKLEAESLEGGSWRCGFTVYFLNSAEQRL